MSDDVDGQPEQKPAKRGEAAWEEAKRRVAERNDRAKKAGRQRRKDYETRKHGARMAAERRQMADADAKPGSA